MATTVSFDGVEATDVTVESTTSLFCVTPPGMLGGADVVVTTSHGSSDPLSDGYEYVGVATNLMTNPSLEVDTTGYTASPSVTTISRDTAWSAQGDASLKIMPTAGSTNPDTFAAVARAVYSTLETGKTYTITATLHLEAPLTGSLATNALSIRAYWSGGNLKSDAAPNEAGDHVVSLTFTPAAAMAAIRLYNGAAPDSGGAANAVWWDLITIIEGDTAMQFDGDTPDTADMTYDWTGTAGASTSTATPTDL